MRNDGGPRSTRGFARRDPATFQYRVTVTPRGFSAHCPEMKLSSEGSTVSEAVVALRAAIARASRMH